jgi:hypothetical protein
MRKPPPISTSWPRETITSGVPSSGASPEGREPMSAARASITAEALLFTTTAASAPVSRQSGASAWP